MPLNYDLNRIRGYKRLYKKSDTGGVELKPIPKTIILSTMSVGMREITEDNYKKFFNRLRVIETIYGSFFVVKTKRGFKQKYITEDDVKAMIGLQTNASEISRSKFLSRIEKELL